MKVGATRRFVVDASMTVAWCFREESTTLSEAVLDSLLGESEAIAPAIWPFEVANALLMSERRKRLTTADVSAVLQRIVRLRIVVDPIRIQDALGTILFLARKEQLTEYDASYLELALREGLPLATLDSRLRSGARNNGVPLLQI
ncbi:MAG TPA: type II toxin-antitoxin system VapC family toxin [Candidatus Binatia bacterium]|nr:type II toxin-antitoxin system VapC family toxin [Candidatus Binatia bacterium]